MPAAWQKWMPLYIDKLWSSPSVGRMSGDAFKGYLALITAQWQSDDCTLPNCMEELADKSRLTDKGWQDNAAAILRKFPSVGEDRLRNGPCYELWMEAKARYEEGQLAYEALRDLKTKAGKIGNDKRWEDSRRRKSVAEPSQTVAPATKCDRKPVANDRFTYTYTETNTETEEQELKATPLSEKPDVPRPEEFANSWNRHRRDLPKVTQFTDSRRKKVQTRQRQGVSLEEFEKAVKACALEPFLSGDNDRGWSADFDWLVENDKNIHAVLEGKYARKAAGGKVEDISLGELVRQRRAESGMANGDTSGGVGISQTQP